MSAPSTQHPAWCKHGEQSLPRGQSVFDWSVSAHRVGGSSSLSCFDVDMKNPEEVRTVREMLADTLHELLPVDLRHAYRDADALLNRHEDDVTALVAALLTALRTGHPFEEPEPWQPSTEALTDQGEPEETWVHGITDCPGRRWCTEHMLSDDGVFHFSTEVRLVAEHGWDERRALADVDGHVVPLQLAQWTDDPSAPDRDVTVYIGDVELGIDAATALATGITALVAQAGEL